MADREQTPPTSQTISPSSDYGDVDTPTILVGPQQTANEHGTLNSASSDRLESDESEGRTVTSNLGANDARTVSPSRTTTSSSTEDDEWNSDTPILHRRRLLQYKSFDAEPSRLSNLPLVDESLFGPRSHDTYKIKTVKTIKCDVCHNKGQPEVYQCQACTAQICKRCVDEKCENLDIPFDWLGNRHKVFQAAYLDRKAKGGAGDYQGMGVKMLVEYFSTRRKTPVTPETDPDETEDELDVVDETPSKKPRSINRRNRIASGDSEERHSVSDAVLSFSHSQKSEDVEESARRYSVVSSRSSNSLFSCGSGDGFTRDPAGNARINVNAAHSVGSRQTFTCHAVTDTVSTSSAPGQEHSLTQQSYSSSQRAYRNIRQVSKDVFAMPKPAAIDRPIATSWRYNAFDRIPASRWDALLAATNDAMEEERNASIESDSTFSSTTRVAQEEPTRYVPLEYQARLLSLAPPVNTLPPLTVTDGVNVWQIPANQVTLRDLTYDNDGDQSQGEGEESLRATYQRGLDRDTIGCAAEAARQADRYGDMAEAISDGDTELLSEISDERENEHVNSHFDIANDEMDIDTNNYVNEDQIRAAAIAELATFEAAQGWNNRSPGRTRTAAQAEAFLRYALHEQPELPQAPPAAVTFRIGRERKPPKKVLNRAQISRPIEAEMRVQAEMARREMQVQQIQQQQMQYQQRQLYQQPMIAVEDNYRPWTKTERQQLWMADMDEIAAMLPGARGRRRSL